MSRVFLSVLSGIVVLGLGVAIALVGKKIYGEGFEEPCAVLDKNCTPPFPPGRGLGLVTVCQIAPLKTINPDGTRNQKVCDIFNHVMDRADEIGIQKALTEYFPEIYKEKPVRKHKKRKCSEPPDDNENIENYSDCIED